MTGNCVMCQFVSEMSFVPLFSTYLLYTISFSLSFTYLLKGSVDFFSKDVAVMLQSSMLGVVQRCIEEMVAFC